VAPRPNARTSTRFIALLTDFGLTEHYVGVMKGVIAGIAPAAATIDISHHVPPQSVLAGQWLLRASVRYFPPASVILAVIDPGVGTSRRPLAMLSGGRFFVGPDNGLFTPWFSGDWQAIELRSAGHRLPAVSATFHGRDVFAPAAAYLAAGTSLADLGPPLTDPVRLLPPEPVNGGSGTIVGEIVYVDHFGNLISNIAAEPHGLVLIKGCRLPVRETYEAVAPGEALALVGSEGQLEIAVRNGSAATTLQAGPGERVAWSPAP
jgi:S-adenosylmethionine hydrolase